MPDRRIGFLLVIIAGLCLSTSTTAIKLALSGGAPPLVLLAYRLAIGWAALVLWILLVQPARLRIDAQGLGHCVVVGSLNTVSLTCFYFALTDLDASLAIFLFSIFPAATLLWLALGGEAISRTSLLRLIVAAFGVYLLVGPGGGFTNVGLLLLAVTIALYSLHLVWVQWTLGSYPALTVTCWIVGTMAVLSNAIHWIAAPGGSPLDQNGWLVVLWTGLVSTAVARLAMFAGIRRIGSGQTALLGPLDTFLSVVWSLLLLGEVLSPIEWLGGLLILLSAGLAVAEPPTQNSESERGAQ